MLVDTRVVSRLEADTVHSRLGALVVDDIATLGQYHSTVAIFARNHQARLEGTQLASLVQCVPIDVRGIDERSQLVQLKSWPQATRLAGDGADKVEAKFVLPSKDWIVRWHLDREAIRMRRAWTTLNATGAKLVDRRQGYVVRKELTKLHQHVRKVAIHILLLVNVARQDACVGQRVARLGPSRPRDAIGVVGVEQSDHALERLAPARIALVVAASVGGTKSRSTAKDWWLACLSLRAMLSNQLMHFDLIQVANFIGRKAKAICSFLINNVFVHAAAATASRCYLLFGQNFRRLLKSSLMVVQ